MRATGTRNFIARCAATLPSRTCCWMASGSSSTNASRRDTQLTLRSNRRAIVQSIAKATLHLRQQPALFQRRLEFTEPQRTIQQQGLGFAHRPAHRFHRVAAQLLERRDALVAVDDQITVRLAGGGYHYDGRLLAGVGQRCQQPPLPLGTAHAQILPAPVELVKLQLHACVSRDSVWGRRDLVFRAGRGKCASNSRGINHIRTELVFRGAQD